MRGEGASATGVCASTGHHLPPRERPRHGAHRLRPARGAQRLPARTPSTSSTPRSTTPAEHRRRLRAAHRQRPSPKDGGWAFCSGGDQRIRGKDGYRYAEGDTSGTDRPAGSAACTSSRSSGSSASCPRSSSAWSRAGPSAAATACTSSATSRSPAASTPASSRPTRRRELRRRLRLGLPGPQVGQKFAREIFFLGRELHAERRLPMGMVNAVVPTPSSRAGRARVGAEINGKSPTASGC
jgi:hypothetical protein